MRMIRPPIPRYISLYLVQPLGRSNVRGRLRLLTSTFVGLPTVRLAVTARRTLDGGWHDGFDGDRCESGGAGDA